MTDLRAIFASDVADALERRIEELVAEKVAAALADANAKRWLTVAEAAKYLGCSEKAVYARIDSGRIPEEAVRHNGRKYLDRLELDRALEGSP